MNPEREVGRDREAVEREVWPSFAKGLEGPITTRNLNFPSLRYPIPLPNSNPSRNREFGK
jgi:hypothetical protein